MADRDEQYVAALMRAHVLGVDSGRHRAAIAEITERVSKARPLKVNIRKTTNDDLIAAAAALVRDPLNGTGLEQHRAAVEALLQRLIKAQQLKEALEAHFQTATGPAVSGGSGLGSAAPTPSAAFGKSDRWALVIAALGIGLVLASILFSR